MQTPLLGISYRLAHLFRGKPHTPASSTSPVKVRIQGFSPSLRFHPPSASQVYFTLLTPFGFSLQGFPLSRSCCDSSSPPCRPAACPWLRSHRLESGSSGALGFILEIRPVPLLGFTAFTPLENPLLGPSRLAPTKARAPLGLSPLQGLPVPWRCGDFRRRSSRVLVHALAPSGCPAVPRGLLHYRVSFA